MRDCWNCDEGLGGKENYCTQCGPPQKPHMASYSFNRHVSDFYSGLYGLLELIDGCPEMLAEGLTEMEGYDDISETEWERRFEDSFQWVRSAFYRLCLVHYEISDNQLEELAEEYAEELEESEGYIESVPTPSNELCSCGDSLPKDAPSIVTRWKEATEVTAVCFDCFGQISSRISVIK